MLGMRGTGCDELMERACKLFGHEEFSGWFSPFELAFSRTLRVTVLRSPHKQPFEEMGRLILYVLAFMPALMMSPARKAKFGKREMHWNVRPAKVETNARTATTSEVGQQTATSGVTSAPQHIIPRLIYGPRRALASCDPVYKLLKCNLRGERAGRANSRGFCTLAPGIAGSARR